jgi:hypothetical protein
MQVGSKTITQGLNIPGAVAFDPQGNLWVANVDSMGDSEYFSEYSPAGKEINAIVQNDLAYAAPLAILAIDGVGDIWTSGYYVSQYDLQVLNSPTAYSGTLFNVFLTTASGTTTVAAHGEWVAFGSATSVSWTLVGPLLGNSENKSSFGSSEYASPGVAAMTFDANSNLYVAIADGGGGSAVQAINVPAGGSPVVFITLNYVPTALAVDSVHGRVYISNGSNSIQVYSTVGTLLHTIQ